MKSTTTFIFCLFLLINPSLAQDSVQVITSWIQQNAIPIRHLEAGNGFSDLQPLKEILKDVKVVGLGEATHGTKEFFQVKHRLLEYLVKEMGFNAFALEASYAASQSINDYVLYGKGDLATVLTGQGYVVWDTEEMARLIEWMRTYNIGVPEEKKVRFYGLDLWVNDAGRREVLNYLRTTAPEKFTASDSLFRILAREESKWPFSIDAKAEKTLLNLLPQLQDLIDYLNTNKVKLISTSSEAEFNQTMQYMKVMKRWLMTNTSALLPPILDKSFMRSIYMAENLLDLIKQSGPETKFVVWQHNAHIAKGGLFHIEPNFGYHLNRSLGEDYYAFSVEFNQGSFQYRSLEAGKGLGDLKEGTTTPAPDGSLAWYLSRSNVGNLIMDLRTHARHPVLTQWLKEPLKVYGVGWAYPEGTHDHLYEVDSKKRYDGIIFIDKTTRTQPTKNALKAAANREGF